MKKQGITLIESVVTIAILGVIFLLVTPLIKTFGGVSTRAKTQKEIDSEFSVVNEFIQKKVKAAKSDSDYAKIYSSISDYPSTTTDGVGYVLHLEIPKESGTPDGILFTFDPSDNKLKYSENSGTPETLMENIADASFNFKEGIILYYIDYGADMENDMKSKFRTSFKGSASTRIDINYD